MNDPIHISGEYTMNSRKISDQYEIRHNQVNTSETVTIGERSAGLADPDPIERLEWDAAVFAIREAHATMDKFRAQFIRPADVAYRAGIASFQSVTAAEEMQDRHCRAHLRALDAAIMTPAPDFEALETKLKLGIDGGCFDGSDDAYRMLRAVLGDIRRLAASVQAQ